jgi:GT2 family glycosyltransferase
MFAQAGTTFDSDAFSLLNASLNAAPGTDSPDLVLCDYDIATNAHEFTQPTFTPGWDPDFIQSQDYIRTAFLTSRRLVLKHRTEASACGTLHDWLCLIARAEARLATRHVTETLAHLPHSVPPTAARSTVKYAFPSQVPDLAVVIPTRNGSGLLAKCLGFLDFDNRFRTELVIVDNASDDHEVLAMYAQLRERHGAKIVQMDHRFNFSRMINMGVEASRAPTILLLNNDVQITMPGLLEEILSHALRPEVGVVGTKLLYGDGKVQHAGMLLREGQSGVETLTALHVMRGASREDSGYLTALSSVRNYQAVTGALMASRREVFLSVGGFDEVHLPVEYNDVDYCLRAREAGYRVVCLPFDGIFHFESSTRGVETSPEVALMRRQATAVMAGRWREQFRHDPYDNRWVELGDVVQEKFPWSAARRT